MNKILSILILSALLLPLASAKDIAYLVRSSNQEANVINAINDLGYTYDIIQDVQIPTTNFANYKIIIVGEGNFRTWLSSIPVNNKTSLIMNTYHMDDWKWTVDGVSFSGSTLPLRADVVNNQSSITQGIPQNFQVYTQASANGDSIKLYYLSKSKKAINLKNHVAPEADDKDSVVANSAKGMVLKGGYVSNARGVFFGALETDFWTQNTKTLFKNALTWLVEDEDKDNDGFRSDNDCNDNNAAIKPGANEVPYDRIDQNCDGYDLADVDRDGFCLKDYQITNKAVQCNKENASTGTDCNDNDNSYNPNSLDQRKDCKNVAPTLTRPIPAIEWNEDSNIVKDLDQYFSDPDGDQLFYTINQTTENENIELSSLGQGNIKFESAENWYGEDWIVFKAQDLQGLSVLSNNVTLRVNSVNDAPILENISDKMVVEGDKVEIVANAVDVEGDAITYSINNANFTQDGNKFAWQTSIGDAKQYTVIVKATDALGAFNTKTVKIFVVEKIYLNEFASNPSQGNEWVEIYNPGKNAFSLSNCYLIDGANHEKALTGNIASKGFVVAEFTSSSLNNDGDIIELRCFNATINKVSYGNWDDGNTEDNAPAPGQGKSAGRNPDGKDTGNNKEDFKIFDNPTRGLASTADVIPPTVTLLAPENNKLFDTTRDVVLEWTAIDNNATNLQCSVYINTALKGTKTSVSGENTSLEVNGLDDGYYSWNVRCSDGYNNGMASEDWKFNISTPKSPVIQLIGDKTVSEGQKLEFTIKATDSDSQSLTLTIQGKPEGSSFNDFGNGTGLFSFTPNFNQSGTYSVTFTAQDNEGMKDSETIKITVNDVKTPLSFKDAPTCLVKASEIDLDIKSPDKGDDFNIGDKISAEVKIKNNFDEDLEFNVEAHLYSLEEDESIEDKDDDVDVDSKDSETVELDLEVPDDADEEDYAVYFYVEDENGRCNSDYVEIEIEREEDNVIIKSLEINPQMVYPGDSIEVGVEVENIGGDDQDVYIEVTSPELNISEKTEEFELEKYGDDDTETEIFHINIPKNINAKQYEIKATVYFSDKEDYETDLLSVLKKITTTSIERTNEETILIKTDGYETPIKIDTDAYKKQETQKTTVKKTSGKTKSSVLPGLSTNDILIIIDVILIIGILIEIVMIRIVTANR
jgi:hypothetical protein